MTSPCLRHLSPPCSRAGVCGSCLREKLADLMEMVMIPSANISKQALSANEIKLTIANQASLHPQICNLYEDSVSKCNGSLADANETKLTIANEASSGPQMKGLGEKDPVTQCNESSQETNETKITIEDQASSKPHIASLDEDSEPQCNRNLAEANETKLSIASQASSDPEITSLIEDSRTQCYRSLADANESKLTIPTQYPRIRNIQSLAYANENQSFASESSLDSQMNRLDENPCFPYDKGVDDVDSLSVFSVESKNRTLSSFFLEGRLTDYHSKPSNDDNCDKQHWSSINDNNRNLEPRSIDNHCGSTVDDSGKHQSGSIHDNLENQNVSFIANDTAKYHLSFNSVDINKLQQRLDCLRNDNDNTQADDDDDKHHRSFREDDSAKDNKNSISMDEYLRKHNILSNDSISETVHSQKSSRITNRIAHYSPLPKSSTKEERNRNSCRRSDSGAAISWISMLFSTRSLGLKSRSKKQQEDTGYEDVWEAPRPSSYEQLSSFERHTMALSSWPELDICREENARVSDADMQDHMVYESVQRSSPRDRAPYDTDDPSGLGSHRRKPWMKGWLSKWWRRAKKKDKTKPASSEKPDYQRVEARHSFSDSFHHRYYQNPLFENRNVIARRSYSSTCYHYSPLKKLEARHSYSKASYRATVDSSTRHIQ